MSCAGRTRVAAGCVTILAAAIVAGCGQAQEHQERDIRLAPGARADSILDALAPRQQELIDAMLHDDGAALVELVDAAFVVIDLRPAQSDEQGEPLRFDYFQIAGGQRPDGLTPVRVAHLPQLVSETPPAVEVRLEGGESVIVWWTHRDQRPTARRMVIRRS